MLLQHHSLMDATENIEHYRRATIFAAQAVEAQLDYLGADRYYCELVRLHEECKVKEASFE